MGRNLTKLVFLVFFLRLLISSSCGESFNSDETRVCISKGGRFLPYESEGETPMPSSLEFKDLNLCKVFHGKTCCSASTMHSASLALENLATYGEATKDCLDMFELLECSICQPNVGIQSEPLHICASFCDRVFEACSDAYFSRNASNQVIVPCGASEGTIICGKASKWESNGTAFCYALGFTVQTAGDLTEEPCYGSKSSLEPVVETVIKTETFAWFQDLQKLVREMTLVQQISWVVTLFLIGTTAFNRRRYQQEIQAMVERDARRLMGNMNGNA
ncbi:unnamed protein product [Arabidopsis arenosa]|uniref:Folate receptor-like domain-containing protein n=1 Tax=Arabidopsis arenosa TaxID=38785 RepID=A0A8S1ZV37_ARAAE|nr:unnamed protein product [Arabidopsis arenosa]